MKILFTLTPAFNPIAGGVQRTTYKLGRYFTEQGLEVYYYSLAHIGHVAAEYGELFRAPEPGSGAKRSNIQDLERVLRKVQPAIVINQMPYIKPLRECLYATQRELGYRLVGCLRNSLFNFKSNVRDRMRDMLPGPLFSLMDNPLGIALVQGQHWLTHRRDLKAIIDRHDYFILLAPPNRIELEYFVGGYKPEKILAIPNSIPEVLEQVPPKEKIILHVGRLNVQQKRSDLLLDFWAACFEQLPDWSFVIVGDGEYRETLERELRRRELPRVCLEGYQKPEPFYKKAAIFMMPSAYEGFPNTILEAQSYGCAVLAYDSYAALSWIVREGQDTLLSPPYDTDHLSGNAIMLAKDDSRRQAIQQAALENARRFTIDAIGKQWFALFQDLPSQA